MKTRLMKSLCLITLTVSLVLNLTGCKSMASSFSDAYSLYQEERFEEALAIFETLDNYRGADDLARECRDRIAEQKAAENISDQN